MPDKYYIDYSRNSTSPFYMVCNGKDELVAMFIFEMDALEYVAMKNRSIH